MTVVVHGYRYSVYTRILKATLYERNVDYRMREVDPFAAEPEPEFLRVSPHSRVPVLEHDGFRLHETAVICRYIAQVFPGAPLVPADPRAEARMGQVIAIVDAYGYWPMVRQVFSHGVFRPLMAQASDPDQIIAGMEAAAPVLDSLELIAHEGLVLNGAERSLADLHLGPMMDYFRMVPDGFAALRARPALSRWWAETRHWAPMMETAPGLSAQAFEMPNLPAYPTTD